MEENKRSLLFIVPILMGGFLALGIWLGSMFTPVSVMSNPVVENTTKFNTILELIEDKYVDSVDHDLLIESSIEGMIKKLDPHSSYIPASDLESVNEQLYGSFGGVGIRFLIHEDSLVATHILPGAPSERAGLLPGDRIIEIDGEDVTDGTLTNLDVTEKLKGRAGSAVKVKVYRKGITKDLSITRGTIPLSSIDAAIMLDSEVGFIKLNGFTSQSYNEFHDAAAALKQKGMKKMIFDLRNNGGGLMSAATDICDEFLKSGKLIVYTEGRTSGKTEYHSSSKGILEDIEVIVLINSLSASASEIVAGAIQDNDRGLIMGRRSFGKGLVQDQSEFTDGSALRLTISRYYTPSGRSIQKPYGDDIDYENDYWNRIESGELLNEDSIKLDENLKFKTIGGRTVYGGGGIYPDDFIPNDTAGASYYLTSLYYKNAFNHFAIKYLDKERENLKDFDKFNSSFNVDNNMFNDFIKYASKLGVEENPIDIVTSRSTIKNRIKAEIARHIWQDNGYYMIYVQNDMDVQEALKKFRSGKSLVSMLIE
ncbi:S41 family peptidase [Paracrocinitomix mangrovi]|uniref:S41 family peptidase n=1 Tax=Paracrocinitomix mangrovi TaxID=2862509 RepID=UPI001C8E4804|nr:S41 family peptidase [Paracrocinitomix mangrovi]UKN00927.1 S41 family peptidase [Paracrocinitomix mangrovi]